MAAQAASSGCFCELPLKNLPKKQRTTKAKCILAILAEPGRSQAPKPYQGKAASSEQERRAEQSLCPAAGQKHNFQSPQDWERAAPAPLSTPPAPTAQERVTRGATKIHSEQSATSNCKWPREVVGTGQDLDCSCSTCPGCSRGEHRALVSHKLN